jgi:DNA-binding GntR family transcriptional regulator
VSWKKQGLNLQELARLKFEEKLATAEVARILGAPRTTVIEAIRKLEKNRGM